MAKGRKGKKKKKNVEEEEPPDERIFYRQEIENVRKEYDEEKARLLEMEQGNSTHKKDCVTLVEDRADATAYLKRVHQKLTDEINELNQQIAKILEEQERIANEYKEKMKQMDDEFNIMMTTLTAEISLLNGKLNNMEEVRSQMDDLMKKSVEQEQETMEQEERHKQILYKVERNFIIEKDKLKKEMDTNVLQLLRDFKNATSLQLVAVLSNALKENVVLNNELDVVLMKYISLKNTNDRLRDVNCREKCLLALHEDERTIVLDRSFKQLETINRLSNEYMDMKVDLGEMRYRGQRVRTLRDDLLHLEEAWMDAMYERNEVNYQYRAALHIQHELQLKAAQGVLKVKKLKAVFEACIYRIKEALEDLEGPSQTELWALGVVHKEGILTRLLQLLDRTTIQHIEVSEEDVETIFQQLTAAVTPKGSVTSVSSAIMAARRPSKHAPISIRQRSFVINDADYELLALEEETEQELDTVVAEDNK